MSSTLLHTKKGAPLTYRHRAVGAHSDAMVMVDSSNGSAPGRWKDEKDEETGWLAEIKRGRRGK
uniref:Uncharacterized protein n=1 Tax=Oryza sativa subsp. japonica TaxID=39947 RepID=Q69K25_ORYSJ|nr:hypothetical protein [Oryza sativa Japonica Group]